MNKTIVKIAIGLIGVAAVYFGLSTLVGGEVKNQLPATTTSDMHEGSSTSTVTFIEYADFECPACAAYLPVIKKVKEEMGSKVNFIFRIFPLPMHVNAISSATAAFAAGEQGKFFEMHDILFTKQEEWSKSKNVSENYINYAVMIGLDIEKFKNDLESEEIKSKVIDLYQEGVKAGIKGTPSFFINGEKIEQKGTTGEEIVKSFVEILNKKLTETAIK